MNEQINPCEYIELYITFSCYLSPCHDSFFLALSFCYMSKAYIFVLSINLYIPSYKVWSIHYIRNLSRRRTFFVLLRLWHPWRIYIQLYREMLAGKLIEITWIDQSVGFKNTVGLLVSFVLLFRTKLPVPMFDRSQISIWSILKQCIGKVRNRNDWNVRILLLLLRNYRK